MLQGILDKILNTIHNLLEQNDIDKDIIRLQLAGYRNYNSCAEEILEVSEWENDPKNLTSWLKNIDCGGGWQEEALEIGLWHANTQEDLNLVIVIGDAPPNPTEHVEGKRKKNKKNIDWDKTRFTSTHFVPETAKLKDKLIPVYTYYLDEKARKDFEYISNETGGISTFIDIDPEHIDGEDPNIVAMRIMKAIIKNIS